MWPTSCICLIQAAGDKYLQPFLTRKHWVFPLVRPLPSKAPIMYVFIFLLSAWCLNLKKLVWSIHFHLWFLLDFNECVTSNLLLCAAFFAWASPRCGPFTQHFYCWRWCWSCSNYHHQLGWNHSRFLSTESWTFGKFQDCGASGSPLAQCPQKAEL